MTSLFGLCCIALERMWKNIRSFAFNNRTVFEIFFIVLYAILQILLIISVDVYPQKIAFTISIFAIIVLSVFALHKLLMESRIKILENNVTDLLIEKEKMNAASERIYKEYHSQRQLRKNINRRKKEESI
jgi:glucan phosphoethanolaminetransferase (alkaline phosphatase superfamily)